MSQGRGSSRASGLDKYDDCVTRYARDVIEKKIIAGPHVRDAARRHMRDLAEQEKRGLFFDTKIVAMLCDDKEGFFASVLKLAGGQFESAPFILHPSQKFIVGSIFGWLNKKDGKRRFRRAYVEQGKGNGKSPLAAGIGIYCMSFDGEARAEIYAAASKRDQAMVLFKDAVAMREQSPALKKMIHPSGRNPVWNLSEPGTGSFFRPIAGDEGQSGPRPHCALCDEIHEHRNGDVIEMLERGFKWRQQPLLFMITNSGSDKNTVCWEEHKHAVAVAAGDVDDDTSFSFICCLDEDDDPLEDETCWEKSNPLLGHTITRDYLRGVVKQAKAIPGKANGILRLHFCEWTSSDKAWLTREALEACMFEGLNTKALSGEEICVGVDLSAAQDLTALAFIARTGQVEVEREAEDGSVAKIMAPTFDCWIEAWTPGDTIAERQIRDSAPYQVWFDQGHLRAPKGKIIRLEYPAAYLAEVSTEYAIRWVAYDRYAFRRFEEILEDMGLDLPTIEHPQGGKRRAALPEEERSAAKRNGDDNPQGLWMPGSLMETELLILEKRIRFKANPVLISAMMSAALEEDPWGNRWLSKRRATNRIDAAVAVCMAVGAAVLNADAPRGSIYDDPVEYAKAFNRELPPGAVPEEQQPGFDAKAYELTRVDFDPEIIRDPQHPDFKAHKERFERWQAAQDDDDPY